MAASITPEQAEMVEETEDIQPPSTSRLIQWLIVLSLAILFVPLYLVSTTIKSDNTPLRTQVVDLESTLGAKLGPNPVEKSLKSTLVQLQKQAGALDSAGPTLGANHVDWPATMAIIGKYDQTRLVLTSIVQNDRTVTVSGQANDENAIMEYAQTLKDSNQFVRVVVQGIAIKPSPTITPSATFTPTPSATPTVIAGTKTKATALATRTLSPTALSVDANSELRDKYATFTILLETKSIIAATSGHS